MFIPYSTDAPIYHLPIATAGLILCNLAVFIAMVTGHIVDPENWILIYGPSLTPLQWLTSIFTHAGVMHLLGNMVFLWVFGLIVEGKLGWWRFLSCYLFIGVVQSAGEQSLMLVLGDEGASLGASSAIYGIMAVAAIWAPKNEVMMFYWVFGFIMGTGEVPVMMLAAFYIGYDVVLSLLLGFHSSSWLHVGGVLVGAPVGVALLKLGIVDCEGWDVFHVWRGETDNTLGERARPAINEAQLKHQKQQRDENLLAGADKQIVQFIKQQNYEAAYKLHQKMSIVGAGVELPRDALLKLITWLHGQKRWRDSCPLLAEVLSRFPEGTEKVPIKLAQICVIELNRPGRALELLQPLELKNLPPDQLKLIHKIAHRARKMQEEGVVELDDDGW